MNQKIIEENKKIHQLQLMIDLTMQLLYQSKNLTLSEGLKYIYEARQFALSLFPLKRRTFDLIYQPRLMRVLNERGLNGFSQN